MLTGVKTNLTFFDSGALVQRIEHRSSKPTIEVRFLYALLLHKEKNMNWEKLHQTSIVADMHCHSAIKKTIFNRDLKTSKTKFLASFFK